MNSEFSGIDEELKKEMQVDLSELEKGGILLKQLEEVFLKKF